MRSPDTRVANELEILLIEGTLLRPFMSENVKSELWEAKQFAFDDLPQIAEMRSPTFTFAHIILPHHPYIFDREGNLVDMPRFSDTLQFLPPEIGINPETFPYYACLLYTSPSPRD